MQILRRVCGPVPVSVSALALSSGKRSSLPLSPAGSTSSMATATVRTRRVSSGIPAWIPWGKMRGGGGGHAADNGLFAGLHTGGEVVPLVQAIYNELAAVTDPGREAQRGLGSLVISKVLALMDKLQPQDLGMSEADFQGLTHPLCIPVFADDEAYFEMTVFVLPKGGEIPLHDHPNMAVLSRILFGTLDVTSFDIEKAQGSGQKGGMAEGGEGAGALDAESKWSRLPRPEEARRSDFAQRKQNRTVTAATPSFLLTPLEGNVHAFAAPVACAVFDILMPPYDSSRGRKCSYFRVEASGVPPAGTTGRVAGAAAEAEGGRDSADDQAAAVARRNRVILREIPEPEGLPRWSRYHGPSVTLR